MENSEHFLSKNKLTIGGAILIAACIIAIALLWQGRNGRYQLQLSNPPGLLYIFDTATGEIQIKDHTK